VVSWEILGRRDAKERDRATAAAVGACLHTGADIVRAHNVEAMRDVVSVADRIWRGGAGRSEERVYAQISWFIDRIFAVLGGENIEYNE
jgi:hypothetical protein